MSTTPVTSTSSTTSTSTTSGTGSTGYSLSSLGGTQQITGLASGLDTDQIISEEMSIYNQPVVALQNQQSGLNAQNSALTSIQSSLQTLESDAQALGDPSLFATTQAVTSSDPTRVTATSTTGAGVGGYQVSITQLANSAQRTFSYTSPASADSVTIDGQQVTIAAGESISSFVNSINSNSNLDVYAAATNSGTVVLSNRSTGDTGTNFIQVQDSGGALSEQASLAKEGQNAEYSVDGVSGTSSSNSVTGAIPGVTLALSGVTTTTGPVTVNVGAPAESATNIAAATQTFITQYNSTVAQIQTQLSTAPSSSDPTVGTLYDDPDLQSLLSSMRSMMYQMQNGGSSSSVQSMLDIGVSTGATTGSGAVSQSALSGTLQLNTATLTTAVQSDPEGVQQMMVGFAAQFGTLVGGESNPGGTIDSRIQGDDSQVTDLGNQISAMQAALTDKQNQLVQQFANLESALSTNQSQASWLTSQIASLPGA
jgi:flagellar hook-associated protein 2